MPAELEAVDRLLDDAGSSSRIGGSSTRRSGGRRSRSRRICGLMFLKYRYRLGFEPLCREVADSISWQRFCRIPLGGGGAASDDVDEDHDPLWEPAIRRVERGVVGPGGRGEGVEDESGAGGHDGGRSERRVSDRLVPVGQGGGRIAPRQREAARALGLATRTRWWTGPVRCTPGPGRSSRTCAGATTTG